MFGRVNYQLILSNNGYESHLIIDELQFEQIRGELKLNLIVNSGYEQIYSSKNI